MGGKFLLKLNIGGRPIANKYREGKMKRTLKRESKVREIVKREAFEISIHPAGTQSSDPKVTTVGQGCLRGARFDGSSGVWGVHFPVSGWVNMGFEQRENASGKVGLAGPRAGPTVIDHWR